MTRQASSINFLFPSIREAQKLLSVGLDNYLGGGRGLLLFNVGGGRPLRHGGGKQGGTDGAGCDGDGSGRTHVVEQWTKSS